MAMPINLFFLLLKIVNDYSKLLETFNLCIDNLKSLFNLLFFLILFIFIFCFKGKRDEMISKINKQIETTKFLTQFSYDVQIKLLSEVRGWKEYFEE